MSGSGGKGHMPKRAFSYVAFSTPEQELGDSERRQMEDRQRFCNERGFVLDDSLQLYDRGVSRFRGRHRLVGAFSRFLSAIGQGRVYPGEVLLVENFDRLSREQMKEAWKMWVSILEAGVLIAVGPPWVIYDEASLNDIAGCMVPLLEMHRAWKESQRKSVIITAQWRKRYTALREKKAILTGKCPLWLRRTEDGFELIEERAQAMREAARLARQGVGLVTICKKLSQQFEPWGNARYKKKAIAPRFRRAYIQRCLRSRELIGEFAPKDGPPIPGYYPAVLTEEEWNDLQAAMNSRVRKVGRPAEMGINLFVGMIYNAATGGSCCMKCDRGQGVTYLVQQDVARLAPFDMFEATCLRLIEELRPEDMAPPQQEDDEKERRIDELDKKRINLDQAMSAVRRQLRGLPKEGVAYEQLTQSLQELADDQEVVLAELKQLKFEARTSRDQVRVETQTVLDMWRKAKGEEKEELGIRLRQEIALLVKEVWVHCRYYRGRQKYVDVMLVLRSGTPKWAGFHAGPGKNDHHARLESLRGVDLRTFRFRGGQ